jgi:hypothetical protein
MRWLLPILAGITLLLPTGVNADELHLKDGSVVIGTVVGYEQDSFRVKTSWGYAEIRKDQVAQIVIGSGTTDSSDAAAAASHKPSAAKKPTAAPAPISPATPPASAPSSPPADGSQPAKGQLLVRAVVSSPSAAPVAGSNSAAAKLVATSPARPQANPKPLPASAGAPPPTDKLLVSPGSPAPDSGTKPNSASVRVAASTGSAGGSGAPAPAKAAPAIPPASVVKPAKLSSPPPPAQSAVASSGADETTATAAAKRAKAAPAPEPVREAITGNEYTNETYGFHMYKPPDWQLNAAARKMMPGAIAALGTANEKTYFFIGLEPAHGALAENLTEADKRLRGILENYRAMGDRQVTISGSPATERRFRGSVDGKDWTGIVAVLPRANQLFTVFGITYADSDLASQIQENVIRRAIDSLAFTPVSTSH